MTVKRAIEIAIQSLVENLGQDDPEAEKAIEILSELKEEDWVE